MKFLLRYRGPKSGLKSEWRHTVRTNEELEIFMAELQGSIVALEQNESISGKKEEI